MIRKSIAAACMLAIFASAAPALAGGKGHGYRGGYSGGHGYNYRYRGGHGYNYGYGHYRYDGAAVFAGGLLLGALLGSLTAPRAYYAAPPPPVSYAPPPQPALSNCRTILGTGYLNGHRAEYQGIGCYDASGNMYPQPGSERFVRYLD